MTNDAVSRLVTTTITFTWNGAFPLFLHHKIRLVLASLRVVSWISSIQHKRNIKSSLYKSKLILAARSNLPTYIYHSIFSPNEHKKRQMKRRAHSIVRNKMREQCVCRGPKLSGFMCNFTCTVHIEEKFRHKIVEISSLVSICEMHRFTPPSMYS